MNYVLSKEGDRRIGNTKKKPTYKCKVNDPSTAVLVVVLFSDCIKIKNVMRKKIRNVKLTSNVFLLLLLFCYY